MKKELLRIENGTFLQNKHAILYSVFIRIFCGDIVGITSDRSYAIEYLMKCLCGQLNFDSGFLYYEGTLVSSSGETGAYKASYTLINERSSFIKTLTLAENVFALRECTSFFFHKKNSEFELRKILDSFHITLSVDTPVKKLNVIQRIQIEMLKARIHVKKILMIDMRNLYLSVEEKEEFRQFLILFRKAGENAIIIFANQPKRIADLVDRLVFLSDGKVLIEVEKSENRYLEIEKNFSLNLDSLNQNFNCRGTKEVLRFSDVFAGNIEGLSFSVREGEVVTISSDQWSTVKEIEKLLKGELRPYRGTIFVNQKNYKPMKKNQALQRYSMVVIEQPAKSQLLPNLSFYDNLCISRGLRLRGFWYDQSLKNSIRKYCSNYMGTDLLNKKAAELTMVEGQQLLYLRWLLYAPEIVVCVEPFKSVDVYLEKNAVDMIVEMSKKGIAVIILTQGSLQK